MPKLFLCHLPLPPTLYHFIIMSLKQFQILNKLGSGSFGIVYKSRRRETNEIVVIKQVQLKRMDRRMRQWALNQAKLMKAVDSPYVVKYYQSFTEKEKLFIVMEYCSGGDLCQLIKGQMGKPLSEDTVWKLTLQVMLGLRDLHAKKILHRDIKTMNVFLTENKMVRIGDLGVARTMTGDFASTVVGTPYYLSPEMCEEKPYNEKTDVWAMGCLVYELCTGKHPFQANTQAALALKIVVGKYAPIPSQYSQTLVWLVRLCLSVDYKRRPSVEYLLGQHSVVEIAKKYGISLEKHKEVPLEKVNEEGKEVKQDSKEVKDIKVEGKEVKVEIKEHVQGKAVIVQKPAQPIKKNQPIKKQGSVEKFKQKSVQKAKINQKQVKKEYKPLPPTVNRSQKDKPPQQPPKKLADIKQKPFSKPIVDIPKPIEPKKIEKPAEMVAVPKASQKKEEAPTLSKDDPSVDNLLLQSKPRKSAQQLVDDDQLFKDFGITPQKLTTMGDNKLQFKKINTINWNITESQPSSQQKPTATVTLPSDFVELPTIKTPSNCEIVPVQCKEHEEEEVAEEMDDNLPYHSDEEEPVSEGGDTDDTLLLEQLPQIEEEGELKRRQKLLLLQRKIFENQRRRKQLMDLREQFEAEILQRISRAQYQQIKTMIREDRDPDSFMGKELNSGNVVKLIKIYHFEIEIARCEENIAKWQEKAKEQSEKAGK